jgi:HK97 family phage prohead protease
MNKKHLELVASIKATGDGSTGTFEGYGSVFGVVDSYRDVVMPGAFKESLENYGMPKLLLQHASWMVGGKYLEVYEDEKGLYVKGELNLEVQAAREVYSLMKQGAISGLSIGYSVQEEEQDRTTGVNQLKKVRLYEVSIVTFPANEEAEVTAVKSAPDNIRDFEDFLREAGKYSQKDAKLIASKGFNALLIHREGGDAALALDALKGAMNQLGKLLPHVDGRN